MPQKHRRTEIVVTYWDNGQRVGRTVDVVDGDISGSMVVPSIEAAQAELTHDWRRFNEALNTHGKALSVKERDAIADAAANIEGGNRWLAAAAIFAALSAIHDEQMGTYFTVPHQRVAKATDEDAS